MRLADASTTVVDAGGRRVIPGPNDSHVHAIRGQAERTAEGQWVRVVGGWSPCQFTEKRMPTIAELTGWLRMCSCGITTP
jgi:predicted amidohydrolase YtcJ